MSIQLNPYSQENIDYLLENTELMNEFIETVEDDGLPKMFVEIHMNPLHPENNNITNHSTTDTDKISIFVKHPDKDQPEWGDINMELITALEVIIMIEHLFRHHIKQYQKFQQPTQEQKNLHKHICLKLITMAHDAREFQINFNNQKNQQTEQSTQTDQPQQTAQEAQSCT
jgi:hypothetical protein